MKKELDKITDYILSDIRKEASEKYIIEEKPYSVMTVYFMLLIKKNLNVDLGMFEELVNREWVYVVCIPFGDVESFFEKHKNEWKRLIEVTENYSEEELKNIILDESNVDEQQESINQLVISLLDINKGEKILEIFDNNDYFIDECKNRNPEATILNYDDEYMVSSVNAMRLDVKGYTDVQLYSEPYEEKDIDKIFVNTLIRKIRNDFSYIINEVFSDYLYEISNSWDVCVYALSVLKKNGKVLALMNGGDLTVKQDKDIREYLCNKGLIEGVIALPEKMIGDIRTNLFLLIMSYGNSTVKFYDAKDKYTSDRVNGKKINRLSEENIVEVICDYNKKGKLVEVGEISRNQYNLNPIRYLFDSEENTVELGNMLSAVNRGITLAAKQADEVISSDVSDIKCIIPSCIMNGVVQSKLYYHGDIKSFKKNYAESGDILITKTGNPFRIAIAKEKYLVIGNIFILKYISKNISAEYVKCFLQSAKGQNEIKRFAAGPSTPIISIPDINKIQIPIYEDEILRQKDDTAKKLVYELESSYLQIEKNEQEIENMFR